jgi:glutathione S-transferase
LILADSAGRMRALQWMFAALNTIEPATLALFANDIFEADRPWSADRRPIVREGLEGRLRDLEAALGERTWLDGSFFSIGDLTMISSLEALRGSGVLERFPMLAAYVARGQARPAHRKALADHLAGLDSAAA